MNQLQRGSTPEATAARSAAKKWTSLAGVDDVHLGLDDVVDDVMLCLDVVPCFDDVVPCFDDVVLCFDDVVLCFADVVLCFDDVMRSRHDVMFRFADVVLCFDVVRPEMDVTQETQRGIFRGASRCCCSFASLSFLSCKNQPARTQSKRSDFKRRSSSSCVHLAFEWLLFTRNWCWQAQQSNFSRRFAPHFPSRAINSTPK